MRPSSTPKYVRGYFRLRRFTRMPIIIGGCERSGTTLLLSILSAHPHIHAIDQELWAFCHGRRAGFDSDEPIRMSRLYKYIGSTTIPRSMWRWCEKSPANIYYFKEILDHFNGMVQLIQIVRDGRDVVSSIHPNKPGEPWVPYNRWIQSVSAGLDYQGHPNVLTIRYEDLIQQFEPVARNILRFLKEDFTHEMLNWHTHARIHRSKNFVSGEIEDIHAMSIRKFELPDFEHHHFVEPLLNDPAGKRLLQAYDYV